MPRLLLLALLLLVAAPLVLLGWVSATALRDQRVESRRRLQSAFAEQLRETDRTLAGVLQQHTRELSEQLSLPVDPLVTLRSMQRNLPIVRRGLLVSSDGVVVFPPPPLSNDPDDIALYAALSGMVDGRPRVGAGAADDRSNIVGQSPGKSMVVADATRAPVGVSKSVDPMWQLWFLDEGLQLIYWVRRADNSMAGALLERARWMSELTAALPDSDAANADTAGVGFTALVDESRRIVYRWGDNSERQGEPFASTPLSAPLTSWRLEFYPAEVLLPDAGALPIAVSLLGVGCVLLALGAYVLSGVQRQMREARNRVSFAGQVSHELRTPLTNIRLYAELAESDLESLPDSPSRQSLVRRLDVIDKESRRLGRLVSGVLEVIRDDRKPRPPKLVNVIPDCVIDRAIEQFAPSFANAGIAVERVAEAGETVPLDADILELVLVNLLSNVEKYAADGGLVLVQSKLEGERLSVTIQDHGVGIPAHQRRKVFTAFARLDDSINAPSGTGIGLAIARRSARRHGGELSLRPGNRGCEFVLVLPIGTDDVSTAKGSPQ